MRRAHLGRGFVTVAQHVSLFPNGLFVLGRDINLPPASATNYNDSDHDGIHPFMVETIGNFDAGHDPFKHPQSTALFKLAAYFVKYEGAVIKFHNEMSGKTCPGSGINKKWFVAEVQKEVNGCKPSNPRTPDPIYTEIPYPGYLIKRDMREPVVGRIQKNRSPSRSEVWTSDRAGVRSWQKTYGLKVDGIVGEKTWNAMFNSNSSYPGRLIKRGSKGEVVKMIQRKLGGLVVDGVFGSKTELAVKKFQESKGLVVDGIVGSQTWTKLFK